jgi:ergothioneine biosynthesis protein EgtB
MTLDHRASRADTHSSPASFSAAGNGSATAAIASRYARVRRFTETLCQTLTAEDCCIQSMPDASPTRWHLAHTTWFLETFVLARGGRYVIYNEQFAYLFNSYYNAVGKQFTRAERGLLSRPTLDEIRGYRQHVDDRMGQLLAKGDLGGDVAAIVELGLQHEQQHQELILTDIKHAFSHNPLLPTFRPGKMPVGTGEVSAEWRAFDEQICSIGHEGDSFAYDNELPRHRVLLGNFEIATRPVDCGQYLEFMRNRGYERPELWLSEGWRTVCEEGWRAPLYWFERDGRWFEFTLAGVIEVDAARPICHVSYDEADAFARWAQARLPTEAEWELAAADQPIEGNFADTLLAAGDAIHPSARAATPCSATRTFGDVWQWTASPYVAYPGYRPAEGALGEYNGKFMCNQFVLRGGSCASSSDHLRVTYRNFFPPSARWQFSGIRLAR